MVSVCDLQCWVLSSNNSSISTNKTCLIEELPFKNKEELVEIAELLTNSQFNQIFQQSRYQTFFPDSLDATKQVQTHLEQFPSSNEYDGEALKLLFLGVACLSAFRQINWTGPPFDTPDIIKSPTLTNEQMINELFVEGGESVYEAIKMPALLLLARSLICFPYSFSPSIFSGYWWASRCLMTQQIMLVDRAPSIKMAMKRHFSEIEKYLEQNAEKIPQEIAAQLYIEIAIFYNFYREMAESVRYIEKAKNATKIELEVSGALGRKTKFQSFDTSQLIVRASSSLAPVHGENDSEMIITTPKEVSTDHELLLKETKFKESQTHGKSLAFIDQLILLAILGAIKRSNSSADKLAIEERMAFLHRIGLENKNWMIHSTFLLYKAQIECDAMKTFDRALLQFQSLIDQYNDVEDSGTPTSDNPVDGVALATALHKIENVAPASERLRFIYTLNYPPLHILKQQLGASYLKYGVAASAREIFLELHLWEDLIRSHMVLQERDRAIEITKERLNIKPTPELWCLLGDLEQDPEHYTTAWNLSNARYAKAQRSLGQYYLNRSKYEEAIPCFKLSLEINALYPSAWFSLGCCCLRSGHWVEAARAFTSCVQQEPEDGEAWSNLSASFQQLGRYEEAFSAIQEGLKHMQESWKLWENAFLLSLQVNEFNFACKAIHRLFDLRYADVKFSWIQSLTAFVVKQLNAATEQSRTLDFYKMQMMAILERASEIMAGNATVWEVYASLHEASKDWEKALDCRQKQVRQLSKPNVTDMTVADFEHLVASEIALGELHFRVSVKKPIHAFVLHLRSLLKKTEEYFASNEHYKELAELHEKLIAKEKELAALS